MNTSFKKDLSKLNKEVERLSKPQYCLLCGKKSTSFCNSHIVPQFVLKNITDNGKISYGQSLHKKSEDIIQTTKGLNNAFTFKLICNKCDKEKFATYETPECLLNFNELDYTMKNNILTEISIKSHLAYISTKVKLDNLYSIVYNEQMNYLKAIRQQTANQIDIKEHFDYLYSLSKNYKKTRFPFEIVYETTLDYKVNIATQSLISYIYDLNGIKRYNPSDLSSEIITRYFYLCIFPFESKTKILFFVEKTNIYMVKDIINQFNQLNEAEKLHFLFVSLIIHSEYFFINPKLKDKLLRDKKITKLYRQTDSIKSFNSYKEIQNFRNYTNYLLKENNVDI